MSWPELMTEATAAAFMDCSPQTIERLRREKKIAPRQLRGLARYHIDDLREFARELPEVEPRQRKSA